MFQYAGTTLIVLPTFSLVHETKAHRQRKIDREREAELSPCRQCTHTHTRTHRESGRDKQLERKRDLSAQVDHRPIHRTDQEFHERVAHIAMSSWRSFAEKNEYYV
jgi:hypothetical protein